MIKIICDTEEEKKRLLKQSSKYAHKFEPTKEEFRVCTLPEMIEVQNKKTRTMDAILVLIDVMEDLLKTKGDIDRSMYNVVRYLIKKEGITSEELLKHAGIEDKDNG